MAEIIEFPNQPRCYCCAQLDVNSRKTFFDTQTNKWRTEYYCPDWPWCIGIPSSKEDAK